MAEQQIIERYKRLAALHTDPSACFVCGKVRPLVNALVKGPGERTVIGRRFHMVCRPCIKAGEATKFR